MKNLDKYKKDLIELIETGEKLDISMKHQVYKENVEEQVLEKLGKEKGEEYIKNIISFKTNYQSWYSESLVLIRQLLPDRVNDFMKLYEKPKTRKKIEYGNYVIEDFLQNLTVTTSYGDKQASPSSAIPQFEQQLFILKSVEKRFESTLFDIKQLTQADIFDSELDSAKELNKKGFVRGAGAICGVILEKHLAQVCLNHKIKITKKNPTISEFNDKLKSGDVIETTVWRKIQFLGDLRNVCDHNKEKEPTKDDVNDLIFGVEKIIKTIF
jgi:hypothetical protein